MNRLSFFQLILITTGAISLGRLFHLLQIQMVIDENRGVVLELAKF